MTDILLQIGATKLVLGVALAGMVWVVQRRVTRPATAHQGCSARPAVAAARGRDR